MTKPKFSLGQRASIKLPSGKRKVGWVFETSTKGGHELGCGGISLKGQQVYRITFKAGSGKGQWWPVSCLEYRRGSVAADRERAEKKASKAKSNPSRARSAELTRALFGGPKRKVTKRFLKDEKAGWNGFAVKVVKYGKDQTCIAGAGVSERCVPTSSVEPIDMFEWARRWDKQFHGKKANPKPRKRNPTAEEHKVRMQQGAEMLRGQITGAQSALAKGDTASYLAWLESLREMAARVSQDAKDAGVPETPYYSLAASTMAQLRKALNAKIGEAKSNPKASRAKKRPAKRTHKRSTKRAKRSSK